MSDKIRLAEVIGGWGTAPGEDFLKKRRESQPGARWFVYQCHALDSAFVGNFYFLACGPAQTYKLPPEYCPGPSVIHAMSPLVGELDVNTGALLTEMPQ